LTSLVDHVMLIYEKLVANKIPCDYLCSTKKTYQDAAVLIGSLSKIGTGMDQATSCPTYDGRPFDLLILVCSIKKYSMLVQNIGRCFRSKHAPSVFHLVDSDDIYKSHWYKCRKWYLTHGGTITEHDIPNLEPSAPVNATANQQAWANNKMKQLAKVHSK
jgi:hypothetical protein